MIAAPDRASLVTAHARLDRVLLWGHYVVPNWHITYDRVAYWNNFGRPESRPQRTASTCSTWWIDQAKEAALARRRRRQVEEREGGHCMN